MRRAADRDLPPVALDDVAGVDLRDRGAGRLRGSLAAARLELIDAAPVLDARADVWPVDAVLAEQLFGHPRDRRRTIDVEIGDASAP